MEGKVGLPKITRAEYEAVPEDYRCRWSGNGNGAAHPEWVGRRCMFQQPPIGPRASVLCVEGVHFVIEG